MSGAKNGAQARAGDWVGDIRSFAIAWGLPAALLLAGLTAATPVRTALWAGGLGWAGIACLINAQRCRRTHCRFTGPFFLVMAVLSVAHGAGLLSLGSYGWLLIGMVSVVGAALLWWGSEAVLGRYIKRAEG